MGHVIEPAASGRARCRGCGKPIPKGELRLGERLPNPFADGEMTLWFHIPCGAYKRPEAFLEAIETTTESIADGEKLIAAARVGIEHRRVPRVDGAQLAPTGRAKCRSCREPIAKQSWRVRLVYFEDGRFEASGFVHASCVPAYFETLEIVDRARHFSPDLDELQLAEFSEELRPK